MTKLSDTQLVILANASQSFDGNVLPLPGSLRGGAQAKVVGALLKRGLIEERVIDSIQPPDASLNRVWRQDDDGRAILLYITKAGLAAINCEPEDGAAEPDTATEGATDAPGRRRRDGGRQPGRRRARGRHGGGRRRAEGAQGPRRHQAGAADRDAPQPRGRHHRGDRRRHWLAAAHGPRRDRRGAEEEAGARRHLREGTRAGPRLSPITSLIREPS